MQDTRTEKISELAGSLTVAELRVLQRLASGEICSRDPTRGRGFAFAGERLAVRINLVCRLEGLDLIRLVDRAGRSVNMQLAERIELSPLAERMLNVTSERDDPSNSFREQAHLCAAAFRHGYRTARKGHAEISSGYPANSPAHLCWSAGYMIGLSGERDAVKEGLQTRRDERDQFIQRDVAA